MPGGFALIVTGIAVIATGLLTVGGLRQYRGGDRVKGILMLVAALVLLGNILIWTWTPAH